MNTQSSSLGEFDLIRRFFADKTQPSSSLVLGIGDDCALLQPAPGQQLAISTDMLLEGRHFLPDINPTALGHKALAVNLSDLAAMGAQPLGFTLAIALPAARAADTAWLDAFSDGLLALAHAHHCPLVGGDTTQGPLSLSLTVLGQVPAGQALRRDGARAGDDIWVSGCLGQARLALGALRGEWPLPENILTQVRPHLERPAPRLALGQALRGLVHSAIDISDGLAGDLGHILRASNLGAQIDATALLQLVGHEDLFEPATRLDLALRGGDDYELAFSAAAQARPHILEASRHCGIPVTRIGTMEQAPGLRLQQADGRIQPLSARAFDHFA